MSIIPILLIAVGLSIDAFAVAVAASVGLKTVTRRQVFRFAFHFGLFQALMPVIGWTAGGLLDAYIKDWDHWVAFALLAGVGGKMIWEAFQPEDDDQTAKMSDPTRGWSLVILSIATSIDALAVGLSLSLLDISIWTPAIAIGLVTASLTTVGMLIGRRLGVHFGQRTEIVGGLILIGIGVKILIEHLTA
ncbi:MAG: manganese efflux pump MntP family protein [Planctomycetota bacterium]